MKLPPNGTRAANGLLFAAGIALGVALTITLHRPARSAGDPPGQVADGESPGRARHLALPPDPADHREWEQMMDAALVQDDPQARAVSLRQAGAAAAREDIRKALRRGLTLHSAQDRLEFHLGIFGVWAETDPQAALDHAHGNFTTGMLQSESIGIAMNKWGGDQPREAWLWAEQNLSGSLQERALTDLMIGWTRRVPGAAADWLEHSGLDSQPVINAVARTWAEQAPRVAADWARTLPAGMARQTAETAVISEWASQDAPAAAEHFEEELVGPEGLNLVIALTDVWGTTDPVATARWLESLPAASNRAEAAGVLASVWGANDIQSAVAWGEGLPDEGVRRKVITHLGTTWGALDPTAALTWLTGLPAAEATDGITGAFYSWAGTNAPTLREWIGDSPAGALSDQARRSLGDVLTTSDPAASMSLALGISDEARRNHAAGRFFREWRRRDQESAIYWMEGEWDNLPAGVQERLRAEQRRGQAQQRRAQERP